MLQYTDSGVSGRTGDRAARRAILVLEQDTGRVPIQRPHMAANIAKAVPATRSLVT